MLSADASKILDHTFAYISRHGEECLGNSSTFNNTQIILLNIKSVQNSVADFN